MKRITYIFIATVSILSASCAKEIQIDHHDMGISLTVSTCEPEIIAKADVSGEDTYNENLLNSFYYFFFKKGDIESTAIVKGRVSGIATKEGHTELIPISADDLNNNLFPDSRDCNLFIIANPTSSMSEVLSEDPTLKELRSATILSSLNGKQDNFVMVYDDVVTVDSRVDATAIDVTVELKRLACKFTIKADVLEEIIASDGGNDITWTAQQTSGSVSVTFSNALNQTTPAGYDEDQTKDEYYFDSDPVELEYKEEKTIDSKKYYSYVAKMPIYSYPMEWVFSDLREPYLLFDVLFMCDDGTTSKPEHRYYKLVLGQESITSNDWYVITVKLTGVGNMLPRDPLVDFRNISYLVMDWNSAFTNEDVPNTSADLKAARFLMVPQTSWEVNNEPDLTIPYSSSHPCTITNLVVKTKKFYDETYYESGVNKPNKPHDIDVNPATAGLTVTAEEGKVVFHHELDNVLSANMDYAPYDITFTLKHTDDPGGFSQTVHIIQYPAIWIENRLNSSGEDDTTEKKGYLIINGQNTSTSGWNKVLGASEGQTGSNTSRYFTIIHVSQFESGESYIIGDPRVTEVNNLTLTSWSPACASAPAIYDGSSNRQLKYYYPCADDEVHSHYIAPALRVNTAHAHLQGAISYTDAQRRCASYQEDGYPAGRWRLPTRAEMTFIALFSNTGIIPSIFLNGSNYRYSGGYMTIGGEDHWGDTTGTKNTRCVYDEWYWSKIDEEFGRKHAVDLTEPERQTFTWGDMPRNYVKP